MGVRRVLMKLNIYFLIEDGGLLTGIKSDKISNILLTEFDSEPVYDEKYLKTKIKSYGSKINRHFHDN